MKSIKSILSALFIAAMLITAFPANAQDSTATVRKGKAVEKLDCRFHYYTTKSDNWFLMFGAGIQGVLCENDKSQPDYANKVTAAMNMGFGKWMSPYIAWQLEAICGPIEWDNAGFSKAKTAGLNFDIMWNMFNSLGSVNTKRIVDVIPFAGVGGNCTWDIKSNGTNVAYRDGLKHRSWTLPVSAGIMVNFKLNDCIGLFVEGRARFFGDNYNGCAIGNPVDVNLACLGGFSVRLGDRRFKKFNLCTYSAYMNELNERINDLRGDVEDCNNRLERANGMIEAIEADTDAVETMYPDNAYEPEEYSGQMVSTVHFNHNSAKVPSMEMSKIYDVATWIKSKPSDLAVTVAGYSDEQSDKGVKDANELATRRAESVKKALEDYGIDGSRIKVTSLSESEYKPYDDDSWNRIVIISTED